MENYPARLAATVLSEKVLLVKALLRHPNHNGLGRSLDGMPILPEHLTEVVVAVNGEIAALQYFGSGLAADPLFGWRVPGKTGDSVTISWRDNLGNRGNITTVVN
jgi:hypothetical protein